MAFARAVFEDFKADRWSDLHKRMTESARANLSEGQLAAECEMLTTRFGFSAEVEILEIQFVEFPERPANAPPMAMTTIEGRSSILPNPVHLASPVSGQVALVLGKSTSKGPGLKSWITVVLQRVNGEWGLVTLHMNNCEANKHDGTWFMNRAEEFQQKGMRRAEFLYRNFGAQLLIPSPFIVVRSAAQQLEHSAKAEAPPNMPFPSARPSETWQTDDGRGFVIESVSIASAPSFLALEIRYKSQKEMQAPQAKAEREALYHHVLKRFPEYEVAFDGVFIGSVSSSGNGFRDYFPFSKNSGVTH